MARAKHYSPAIDRQIVCALYHEAKRRRQPMTKLADELLSAVLRDTQGWKTALDQQSILQEQCPPEPLHFLLLPTSLIAFAAGLTLTSCETNMSHAFRSRHAHCFLFASVERDQYSDESLMRQGRYTGSFES